MRRVYDGFFVRMVLHAEFVIDILTEGGYERSIVMETGIFGPDPKCEGELACKIRNARLMQSAPEIRPDAARG